MLLNLNLIVTVMIGLKIFHHHYLSTGECKFLLLCSQFTALPALLLLNFTTNPSAKTFAEAKICLINTVYLTYIAE